MSYVEFTADILKFSDNGDKTKWTYILVPAQHAQVLKPGNKKSFRVKGKLDAYEITQVALLPYGDGKFMMAINGEMRKQIKKQAGAKLKVRITAELEDPPLDTEMIECLKEEPEAWERFSSLTKSHQRYFSNWVSSGKTNQTKDTRIAHTVNAMIKNWDYGQLVRSLKKDV
jgi:hypothetical protein